MTQSSQTIDQIAASWAVRQKTRALTAQEQVELDRWLATNPRHRGALLRACAQWTDLDRLSALTGHQDLIRSGNTIRPRHRRRWLIAASVTLFALGGATAAWIHQRSLVFASDIGQIRKVTLSDGSNMVLDTATRATVRFTELQREIELATGEGLFHVAKDPARPFIVKAGRVSIRAVGTVFSVRSLDKRVDVTVTEGVVELVDHSGAQARAIRRVAANERATVMETQQVEVERVTSEKADRLLAWRDGMIEFAGEPLADAVSRVNRYNHRQIVVDDAELGSRPVVGNFRANDPEGFAATIAVALSAQRVDRDDAIHLRSAAP